MMASVLILAGQREGVIDALCADAGIDRKALIPINGRPMIDYVLDALSEAGFAAPFHVSGLDAKHDPRLIQSPAAPGPAGSALAALEAGIKTPAIITTCDHALLTAEMLSHFLLESQESGADFCIGLADKSVIQPAYPHVKRTYLKFTDRSVSGCNLFYISNQNGLEAIRFWRRAQQYRKRPVRLAASVGIGILLRYLSGKLTLAGAFSYASKRLKIDARPILIPIAEAAIDVDKLSDKDLVEQILKDRVT